MPPKMYALRHRRTGLWWSQSARKWIGDHTSATQYSTEESVEYPRGITTNTRKMMFVAPVPTE